MTRFLAVIRRLFLAGLVSLCLILLLLRVSFSSLIADAITHSNVREWYSVFFLAAPILYLVVLIISVSYVRKHGQFAAVHASKPYFSSVF
ncbi:hypothetical protein SAMN02910371_02849 [Butyrivibrio sp. INlla14]|nr:hypothetical protein SAMN02910371_02849 [Butyrivibrio sp. INlla14]